VLVSLNGPETMRGLAVGMSASGGEAEAIRAAATAAFDPKRTNAMVRLTIPMRITLAAEHKVVQGKRMSAKP
jgi:hypothetical protein